MMHFAKKYQNFVVDEEPLDCYARLKRNDESGTEIIKRKKPFLAIFFDGRDLKDSEAAARDFLQSSTSAPKHSP